MGYRALLEADSETVQDLVLSASRRLAEAMTLYLDGKYHTAIYIAGLSAEMYLKTSCYFVGGAIPATPTDTLFQQLRPKRYKPPFPEKFESGHNLWFWYEELLHRRKRRGHRGVPRLLRQVIAAICTNWYIGMRYRPGMAVERDAERFLSQVEWLAANHVHLRS